MIKMLIRNLIDYYKGYDNSELNKNTEITDIIFIEYI